MPKVGMEEIRRRQLIEATVASLHADGFGNTTLARIAGRAGLSSGIVAHYFRDKAGLLEATMRHLAEELRAEALRHLARARGPEARLAAIIDSNLAPSQYAPEVMTAWLAFWGQVPHVPRLRRIQRIYEERLLSNLRYNLKQLLPPAVAAEAAIGLASMIDGLWLRAALSDGAFSSPRARALARAYLATLLTRERAERATEGAA
ncbi:MAG: transcriptional regulator BetI [Kiloniellales bacterium]